MTKLWATNSGVTLWTKSSSRSESVARINADTGGNVSFSASNPKDTYSKLIPNLVYDNTADFRYLQFYLNFWDSTCVCS